MKIMKDDMPESMKDKKKGHVVHLAIVAVHPDHMEVAHQPDLDKPMDESSDSLANMPLAKARQKIKQNSMKIPPLSKNEPLSDNEQEDPNSGY